MSSSRLDARRSSSCVASTPRGARVFVKMESRGPCGSVKDRVGAALVEDAEKRGLLKPGAMLIEPTSSNTGVALAFVAAAKGYRLTLTMPEHISQERVAFLRMLGAQIVFTPGSLMGEAVRKAEKLVAATPGAVMLQQFRNPRTPRFIAGRRPRRIWTDMDGDVDVLSRGRRHRRHDHGRRRGPEGAAAALHRRRRRAGGRRRPAGARRGGPPPAGSWGASFVPEILESRDHRRGRRRHRGGAGGPHAARAREP